MAPILFLYGILFNFQSDSVHHYSSFINDAEWIAQGHN